MKALILESAKKSWSVKNVADPIPVVGNVLVRMKAAAFNHRDIWISKGMYPGIKYPIIPGSDGAGVVEAVGSGVSRGLLGQQVLINPSMNWGDGERFQGKNYEILGLPKNGTFAELVKVEPKYIHPIPMHLSFEQAAALPLAGLTAYRSAFSRAKMRSSDRVLITGIGGGVALFALQFALLEGCEVWVTSSSEEKIRKAISLGAAGGMNYKKENWALDLKSKAGAFSVIIDGAGGKGFGSLIDLADLGGRIVVYGGTAGKYEKISPQKIFWKQLTLMGSTMGSEADFHGMMEFVRKKELVPVVDEVFPFDESVEAAEKMANGKQFGKVVVSMGLGS